MLPSLHRIVTIGDEAKAFLHVPIAVSYIEQMAGHDRYGHARPLRVVNHAKALLSATSMNAVTYCKGIVPRKERNG